MSLTWNVRAVCCGHTRWQDDIYRPNYYQSLMEFREQTLQRLQKFVAQKFFSVRDYVNGEGKLANWLTRHAITNLYRCSRRACA